MCRKTSPRRGSFLAASDGCMLGPVRFSSAETGGEMRTFLITLLKVVLALSFAIQ